MGSSRIIMLSGVYLILGFYTVSFYNAERTNSETVTKVGNTVQAEQLARTGVSMALAKMANNSSMTSFSELTASLSNGTVKYKAATTSGTTKITSTATFNGRTVVMTAVFTYTSGRWRISRTYATPVAELVSLG